MTGFLTVGDKSYPFDEDIFCMQWYDQKDLVSDALVQSGAMVEDGYIASQIANGSDTYTIPFYGLLEDVEPANYDGKTDIPLDTIGAGSQTGVVFGRTQGWSANQFVADFTTANPMAAIAARVGKYWLNYKQKSLVGTLEAVTGLAKMSSHVETVDALTPVTFTDAAQKMFGAASDQIAMLVMHSAVAQFYKDKQVLEYWKYTDPNGVTRDLTLFSVNGIPTIVDDGVPHTAASGSGDSAKGATYTTYMLGAGALLHADAPVTLPVETHRDPVKNGGVDMLLTRTRQTIHPNGFSFKMPTGGSPSPTDTQLHNKANWELVHDAQATPIAKVVSPGFEG